MRLLNYDFYDLYALLVYFRADVDKVSEYAEAIERIIAYLDEPIQEKEIAFNSIRKVLQLYVSKTESALSWVWTENVYTGNVVLMKDVNSYCILKKVFQEILLAIGNNERLWSLCDATHNLPVVLANDKKSGKIIKSMVRIYQKKYNKYFLVEELKEL